MLISHKIELDPNNKQATYFARAAGTARFAYNWALVEWKRQYEECKTDPGKPKPSQTSLRRQLNAIKREQFPWMLEVTKNAPQMAIIQLGQAFQNFLTGRARYPSFRKRGVHDSFSVTNDQFHVDGRYIHIPGLGRVRLRECLRFNGKVMSATVSRVADRWFVSVTVDCPDPLPAKAENQGVVGVELGVSVLPVLSTGEIIEGPKPHRAALSRLRRLSRSLSRKQKGSRNREKVKRQLDRLYSRITNIRNDFLHKLTSDMTRRFHTVCIGDLHAWAGVRNRYLAHSIADMGFPEFYRQLEYKSVARGGIVVVAENCFGVNKLWYPNEHKRELFSLFVHDGTCPAREAGNQHDVNPAINLRNYAVSSTVSACGEDGSGSGRKSGVNPASVKQEFSAKY